MNKTIKAKWVKALLSGKYKQARGTLKNRAGAMCCLGVLCDIQGADFDIIRDTTGLKVSDIPQKYNAGLKDTQRDNLANMNDGAEAWDPKTGEYKKLPRSSFKEIAAYIKEHL